MIYIWQNLGLRCFQFRENVCLLFGKWSLVWKEITCMGSVNQLWKELVP